MQEYGISARLTFSNSLLREEHLADWKCNALCALFEKKTVCRMVSSSIRPAAGLPEKAVSGPLFRVLHNKVLTDFQQLRRETEREEFRYVVPDFRLNKSFAELDTPVAGPEGQGGISVQRMLLVRLPGQKALLRECQPQKSGRDCPDHRCTAPGAQQGYRFSKAMENPGFIGAGDIRKIYLPGGFPASRSRGGGTGQRVDTGISALLHDKA